MANIWVAAADNDRAAVERELDAGASPNVKDPNGYTPMHAAALYGHLELLRFLVTRGGNVNVQDNEGDTPLHHVEDVGTARALVEEMDANHTLCNSDGDTAALYIEKEGEHVAVAQYLRLLAPAPHDSLLANLPSAGSVNGHLIRYTTAEDTGLSDERRRQLEAVATSENPEEALRELVTSAVREGLASYKPLDSAHRKRQA